MNLERYEFIADDSFTKFDFYSIGPKGIIKKAVRFFLDYNYGIPFMKLAFGDWDESKQEIDDKVVTNNKDDKKVLATVAAIVIRFTDRFPHLSVYAEGSTPSRTRLYQIGIVNNWKEIDERFTVYGVLNKRWEPFRKNVNYGAFLIRKK